MKAHERSSWRELQQAALIGGGPAYVCTDQGMFRLEANRSKEYGRWTCLIGKETGRERWYRNPDDRETEIPWRDIRGKNLNNGRDMPIVRPITIGGEPYYYTWG